MVVAAVGVFDSSSSSARRMIWSICATSLGQASMQLSSGCSRRSRGVLGQVVQALDGLRIARVADEAVGLGQRRLADEVRVSFHRKAGGDAGAALDAGHRLGDVEHRLRIDVPAPPPAPAGQEPRATGGSWSSGSTSCRLPGLDDCTHSHRSMTMREESVGSLLCSRLGAACRGEGPLIGQCLSPPPPPRNDHHPMGTGS